ncbi:splicing factor 3B subunit 2 isoform X2 [Ranitomeya variabilis]
MAATNSRLAQMAGMPMPTPPPPPPSMGMGFPLGLNPRLTPDQENGKPPQTGAIPQPNDGLPKATLLEPEATRSLLLSRGNLVTHIPPLMPSLNRIRALNQSGDDSKDMEDSLSGPKIPQVLEKILQLKEIRQEEMMIPVATEEEDYDDSHFYYDIEEETTGPTKEKKSRRRKNRKKRTRRRVTAAHSAVTDDINEAAEALAGKVEIEYVTEEPDIYDPNFIFFKRIFQAFKLTDDVKKEKEKEPEKVEKIEPAAPRKRFEEEMMDSDSDSDAEDKKLDAPKLSKKKLRRMNRFTVAELKQLVSRPDVVEMHDVTAQDPKLLVHLKGTRNSVPVPRHWCFKRKYLQGKRGIEKPPFQLPEFIKRTGIQEMREALQEKEEQKTMKSKMREKVRPKMGKIDIDYQKLHDAFFKWQNKPKLTIHGDLYYEGKEFETRLKEKKPGDLSDELKITLGMPVGPNSHKVPPPWLIAMQRYGPPPSYPNLKIPGLNSPIPESCSFGYHAGGWGKPPVDEMGKPLYGDVFGTNSSDFQSKNEEEDIDRTPWGELELSDDESSSEEEEEESDEDKPDETGFITPADSGLITPGGFSSVPAGMETPELIELRKKKNEEAMDGTETPLLFTVLPEKRMATVGGAIMGSTHIYDITSAMSRRGAPTEPQGVEVALAPEELELDPSAMTQKYEERVREAQEQVQKEDFSDMVAEHAAKQKQKKRKGQPQDSRSGKKYKEFKF